MLLGDNLFDVASGQICKELLEGLNSNIPTCFVT